MILIEEKSLSTFWEFNDSSFEQAWMPFTQECFVANVVEIGQDKKIFYISLMYFTISKLSPLRKKRGLSF